LNVPDSHATHDVTPSAANPPGPVYPAEQMYTVIALLPRAASRRPGHVRELAPVSDPTSTEYASATHNVHSILTTEV